MSGRHSIKSRVLLLVAVGMLGPLAVIAWAGWKTQRAFERETLSERALLASLYAARVDALLSPQLSQARELDDAGAARLVSVALFKPHRGAPGESIDLVDTEGVIMASTDAARVGQRSEDIADLVRERRSASTPVLAFAPLSVAHWGVVVRQPHPSALAGGSLLSLVLISASLLAVALLFAWGASRSVTRPLATLTRAAGRIAEGDLADPIPQLPEDEVGRLGESLERMRVALKESLLRQLLARTLTAQEHERRRVARELHDETTQSLAALIMHLRAGRIEDATALAVRTLDEVHRMIVDLRPSVLDDLGLKSAIVWYAERRLKGLSVRCEFSNLDQRLPPQHETAVFRVAQEAMNNIARHASAESVLIQGAIKDGKLSVEVEDDGEGFDAGAVSAPGEDGRGWGLLGMRERVEMLGGALRIDSAKGRGTHVALSVPVEAS